MAACCVKYSTWATSFDDREKRVMQITKSGDLTPAELPRAAMAPSGENSETDVPCRGVTSLLWCDPIIGWLPGLTVSLPIGDFFLFTLPTQLRRSWMRVHCAGIAGQLQLSLARHKCRLCIAMQDGAGICTRHVQCSIYACYSSYKASGPQSQILVHDKPVGRPWVPANKFPGRPWDTNFRP